MARLSDEEIRDALPHLQRFALWLTRDITETEDLVQNTMMKALASRSPEAKPGSLRAWLFSILWRQFLDNERRRRRWQHLLALLPFEERIDKSAEHYAMTDEMLSHFSRMPAESRALLLLVSVEGLSYQETAETLGIPIGTVMSRLSRARKRLHELIEGQAAPASLRRLK